MPFASTHCIAEKFYICEQLTSEREPLVAGSGGRQLRLVASELIGENVIRLTYVPA